MLNIGDNFPEFTLLDQDGKTITNADLKGAPAVVYFYPKDDTTGCTAEACGFQEHLPQIPNVRVVGVSPDSVKSHRKFADKYGLAFTLLADTEQALCSAAGVWVEKSMYGKTYMGVARTTFILDAEGKITKIFEKVKANGHAAEVLAALG